MLMDTTRHGPAGGMPRAARDGYRTGWRAFGWVPDPTGRRGRPWRPARARRLRVFLVPWLPRVIPGLPRLPAAEER
jgi:hypothetical protein